MKTNHTPGPLPTILAVDIAGHEAEVMVQGEDGKRFTESHEAREIAHRCNVYTELLAALQACLSVVLQHRPHQIPRAEAIRDARAAIARARGPE